PPSSPASLDFFLHPITLRIAIIITTPIPRGARTQRTPACSSARTSSYPRSRLAPPSTPALKEEKRPIEERERERRRRVVRSLSTSSLNSPMVGGDSVSIRSGVSGVSGQEEALEWWAMDKVKSFYRECCEGCLEPPDKGIMQALKVRSVPFLIPFLYFF
ncbi:hypothetical protein C8J57DRAFT_1343253, partial [Mycena rebaudengoi]